MEERNRSFRKGGKAEDHVHGLAEVHSESRS